MTQLSKKFLLLGAFACVLGGRAGGRADPARGHRRARLHELGAEHAVVRVARGLRRRRLPRPASTTTRTTPSSRRPTDAMPNGATQRVGQLVRRRDAAARRPVRHLRPGQLLVPQRLAVAPRRPELVLDGHDARPPRLHHDRPLQADAALALGGGAAYDETTQVAAADRLRRRRRRPVPGQLRVLPVRRRPTTSATRPATSTATTPAARCRRAAARRRPSPAPPTVGHSAAPTARVWACVLAADASIPDNPNGPNQRARPTRPTSPTRSATACCSTAPLRRSRSPAAGRGQGRRARLLRRRGGRRRPPGSAASYNWRLGDDSAGGTGAP